MYSAAIVRDLKQLETTVFDDDVELSSPGIDGILQQLLQCMNRGDDDFSGGDFVDDILRQSHDARRLLVGWGAVSLALGASWGLGFGHLVGSEWEKEVRVRQAES
jgi:hypothetical protein